MKSFNFLEIGRALSSRPQSLASVWKNVLKSITSLVTIGLSAHVAHAQIQQAWAVHYNNGITTGSNQAVKLVLDAMGNIYVTGCSQNTNSQLGYVTIKYAPNGNQVWAARYDSTSSPTATPAAMVLDGSNNIIVTGNALTVKYSPNGNQLWNAPYAGTTLAVDASGNVYVAGFGTEFDAVKLSPSGGTLWHTTYTDVAPTISQSILVDSAENVYVSGQDPYEWVQTSEYNPNQGFYAVVLTTIKYASNGSQIWRTSYDIEPQTPAMQIAGSALDSANSIYLVVNPAAPGYSSARSYWLFKFASNGNLEWESSFDLAGEATGLCLDTASNVLLTGQASHTYPFFAYGTAKLDTNGDPLWVSYYPQQDLQIDQVSGANGIALDPANNSYVTGYFPGTNSSNYIATVKYSPSGNQLWVQTHYSPGNGNAAGKAIAVDNNGNVYVTGYDTTTAGGTEIVTIKYSSLNLQPQTNGTILLQALGLAGEVFNIQASANLQTWQNIGSATADTNGLMQFSDTNALNYPARFYSTSPQ